MILLAFVSNGNARMRARLVGPIRMACLIFSLLMLALTTGMFFRYFGDVTWMDIGFNEYEFEHKYTWVESLGINWAAYNSSNGRMEFAFHYAQPNNTYYVHTNREHYATHNIEVFSKTTTGFTTKWSNSDGTNLSPATFGGVLIVYASDPIEMAL